MLQFIRRLGNFLFGTARRFWATLGAVALVFAYFRPDIIQTAIVRLLTAIANGVAPFIPLALVFFFIFLGYRTMWKGVTGGAKKKRR